MVGKLIYVVSNARDELDGCFASSPSGRGSTILLPGGEGTQVSIFVRRK
jgi:hypothetical protein